MFIHFPQEENIFSLIVGLLVGKLTRLLKKLWMNDVHEIFGRGIALGQETTD